MPGVRWQAFSVLPPVLQLRGLAPGAAHPFVPVCDTPVTLQCLSVPAFQPVILRGLMWFCLPGAVVYSFPRGWIFWAIISSKFLWLCVLSF